MFIFYFSLKFYSENGELIKMNPTILAALNSSLVSSLNFLNEVDYEDCCVITEFSKSELEEINQFSWTGQCKNTKIFDALGIDLTALFYNQEVLSEFKVEVKEEIIDHIVEMDYIAADDNFDENIILSDLKIETKKTKVKNNNKLKTKAKTKVKQKVKSKKDKDLSWVSGTIFGLLSVC